MPVIANMRTSFGLSRSTMAEQRTGRAGGRHQRGLGPERPADTDAQQRGGDQRAQAADLAWPAEHVDVADEELDVVGRAEPADEHGHQHADADEERDVRPARRVVRSDDVGDATQDPQVGGADEPAEHACGDDADNDPATGERNDPEQHD